MTTYAGQWGPQPFIDTAGNAVGSALVYVYDEDGTTLSDLYVDPDRTAPLANPLPTGVDDGEPGLGDDGNGMFYAEPATHVLVVTVAAVEVYRGEVVVRLDPRELGASGEVILDAIADAVAVPQAAADAAQAAADAVAADLAAYPPAGDVATDASVDAALLAATQVLSLVPDVELVADLPSAALYADRVFFVRSVQAAYRSDGVSWAQMSPGMEYVLDRDEDWYPADPSWGVDPGSAGVPTWGRPAGVNNKWTGWTFPAGADSAISKVVRPPQEWLTMDVWVIWFALAATLGRARFRLDHASAGVGELLPTFTASGVQNDTAGQNVPVATRVLAGHAIVTGRYMSMTVMRNGLNAADTLSTAGVAVGVLGVLLRKAS